MFILKGIEQLEKAIAKAKKVRPRVEFDHFGRYRVSGSKGYYTVICRKDERGYKTVACTCKGAEKGLVCYHAASALSLHIGLARREQDTPIGVFTDANEIPYLKPSIERPVERVGGIRIN
jgi:hypothetical protein